MIYLSDLLDATGGRRVGPASPADFPAFCYDSRRIRPGELFTAVKTEGGDGHDYIAHAIQQGAGGVLCQFPPAEPAVPCVVVPDTQLALTDWAAHVLRKHTPDVVGVTGSTGKTDACQAMTAVLSTRMQAFSNPPDLSDRFGLPISLAELSPAHRVAVLELACNAFDEIAQLADLTRPHIAVVTAVSEAHLAFLNSLEAISQEKGRLVEALHVSLEADAGRHVAGDVGDRVRARAVVLHGGAGDQGGFPGIIEPDPGPPDAGLPG